MPKKKVKDLYAEVFEILKDHYFDLYNKHAYYTYCARAVVKLVESKYDKKEIDEK